MAINHINAKVGSRSTGQSAAAKFAYICREGRYSEDRPDVENRELVYAESQMMPAWAEENPALYWQSADLYERANGRLFQQVEFALPRELSREAQIELAQMFALEISNTKHGFLPYTLAIHAGKGENPHAHLMMSERVIDGYERTPETWFKRAATGDKSAELGGAKKTDAFQAKEWIGELRETWAVRANQMLAEHGREERIDHRSHAERGLDQLPTVHEGPDVRHMRAKGFQDDRVALNSEIRAVNAELVEIRTQSDLAQRQLAAMLNPAPEHKTETQERVTPEVRRFIEVHSRDFTTHDQAKAWFDREAERLAKLENPATARSIFEKSSGPYENGRANAALLSEAQTKLDRAIYAVRNVEKQIEQHRDRRTFFQRLFGRPDVPLERLKEQHSDAMRALAGPQNRVQELQDRWTTQTEYWQRMADYENAPRMEAQQREVARLDQLRPQVLAECQRRDTDPQVQIERHNAEHVRYVVSELRSGTELPEIRQNLLYWRLNSNSPEAQKLAAGIIEAGQKQVKQEREAFQREYGPQQQRRPKMDFPSR